jgi:hypothetical protein
MSFLNHWLLLFVFIESVPWARETYVERDKIHLRAYVVKCFANFRIISSKPCNVSLKTVKLYGVAGILPYHLFPRPSAVNPGM